MDESSTQMVTFMTVNGKTTKPRVVESTLKQMELSMTANGSKISRMDTELRNGQMEVILKELIKMA